MGSRFVFCFSTDSKPSCNVVVDFGSRSYTRSMTTSTDPQTTATVVASIFSRPAYTKAIEERPEIRVWQTLQKPKDKNEVPQAINGFVPTGNKESLLIIV
jgi:hypothetical protein